MAIWMFTEKSDGNVEVTYAERGSAPRPVGSSPPALVADALAWAADTSAVGDVLVVGGLPFVRYRAPALVMGRVLRS